ncbi:MAG TPA: hypothetical protein VF484_06795 [Candidatus Limnocylindrales bacterium]
MAAIVAVVLLNQGLPGIQSSAPPWPPETSHLLQRMQADGLAPLPAEGTVQHTHQHLDIYLDGQPVQVPANIGINRAQGFLSAIHTHDTSGIIHVESPTAGNFALGQFFDVWGVRFDAHCLGGSCDSGDRTLRIYVNGKPFTGDPRLIVLEAHQEIVVAFGTAAELPSPIPSSYIFPAGL